MSLTSEEMRLIAKVLREFMYYANESDEIFLTRVEREAVEKFIMEKANGHDRQSAQY